MYEHHLKRVLRGNKLPRMRDLTVRAELLDGKAKACGLYAPVRHAGTPAPFRCNRAPGHEGDHVATLACDGTWLARWDEDRSTDQPLETTVDLS